MGGCYTGINVTTSIMLCHDMDFAIPLHIHGFRWMDRRRFFPSLLHHQRERCTAWASIDRNRMVFASNTRSTFKYILTDLYSRIAHKLGYNNFPKCNLCGNISKSVNGRLLTVGNTRSLFTMLEILEEKYKYWIRGRGLIWMNILRELFRKL